MTEAQRDYLADLANRKGVRLANTDEKSVAWTSEKIEELKNLPDATFVTISAEAEKKIARLVEFAKKELRRWNFNQ